MKRTLRLLAVPAAAMLLLASCGTNDEPAPAEDTAAQEAPQADAEPMDDGGNDTIGEEDESDSWPIVEDEDGNVVENPQGDAAVGEWGPTGEGTAVTNELAMLRTYLYPEAPADIESLRDAAGEDAVGYISVEIDNSQGSDTADVLTVDLVDENGDQYHYEKASDIYSDWAGTMRDDGPDEDFPYWYSDSEGNEISEDQYDELQALAQTLDETHWDTSAMPTATTTAWLIGPEVPETVTYAEVTIPGMDSFELTPMGT